MIIKLLLNIFYTIAIILLLLSNIWSFNHHRFDLLVAGIFLMVLMVLLKIRLARQVKSLLKR